MKKNKSKKKKFIDLAEKVISAHEADKETPKSVTDMMKRLIKKTK